MGGQATWSQRPAGLNLNLTRGDDASILFDFSIDLTGYTFTAAVGSVTPTIEETDLGAGQITMKLTDTQMDSLESSGPWYLQWTTSGSDRTVVAGTFTVQAIT